MTLDRAGRWHVAFAHVPEPVPTPGSGQVLCTACGHTANADVNAALNIAAGHAVKAREADRDAEAVNREPQLDLLAS